MEVLIGTEQERDGDRDWATNGVGTGWGWNGSSMRTTGGDGMEMRPGSGQNWNKDRMGTDGLQWGCDGNEDKNGHGNRIQIRWNMLDIGTRTGPQCWAWAENTTLFQGRAAGSPQHCAQAGTAMGARGPQGHVGPWRQVCLGTAVSTHACSCVVWHLHRSRAGTRHSGALLCCRGSAGTALCAGHTPLGPSHRCYRGTGRAGSAHPAEGPHSTQGHTHHSGNLLT